MSGTSALRREDALGAALLPCLAAALLLSGCAPRVDRDEAAVCTSAAAGLATPVRVRVTGSAPLPEDAEGRAGLRLALAPEDPDTGLFSLTCRFEGRTTDLVALATPKGPVDETHLVLLKRFWLGSDAARSASDAAEAEEAFPELPAGLGYPLQQFLNVLPDAFVYGLLAAAYALIYGLRGRINLAFGEVAAVGGVAAVAAAGLARAAPPAAALVLTAVFGLWAAALHGVAVERLVLWPSRRSTGQQGLVATVGVALVLREYLRLATGSRPLWIAPVLADPFRLVRAGDFVVTVTPMALTLAGAGALASAALLAGFRFTGFGRDWRATSDDPLAAALMGVDPRRLSLRTSAVAFALAGLAGAGVTLDYGGVGFDYTTGLGLKALIAAILGGIGSVPGAFLGGVGIALTEAAWSTYLPVEHRDLAIDVLLVLALVLRPGGLFGTGEIVARRPP